MAKDLSINDKEKDSSCLTALREKRLFHRGGLLAFYFGQFIIEAALPTVFSYILEWKNEAENEQDISSLWVYGAIVVFSGLIIAKSGLSLFSNSVEKHRLAPVYQDALQQTKEDEATHSVVRLVQRADMKKHAAAINATISAGAAGVSLGFLAWVLFNADHWWTAIASGLVGLATFVIPSLLVFFGPRCIQDQENRATYGNFSIWILALGAVVFFGSIVSLASANSHSQDNNDKIYSLEDFSSIVTLSGFSLFNTLRSISYVNERNSEAMIYNKEREVLKRVRPATYQLIENEKEPMRMKPCCGLFSCQGSDEQKHLITSLD